MAGHRKSYRLKNYDYSRPGFYFITIVTKNRVPYFGVLKDTTILLSECGEIAKSNLLLLPSSFPHVSLDEYVIMPDHIHVLLCIEDAYQEVSVSSDSTTVSSIPSSVASSAPCSIPCSVPRDDSTHDSTSGGTTGDSIIEAALPTDRSWILMSKQETHLGKIVRHFKAKTSFMIRKAGYSYFGWVTRYYDRIVRDDKSLNYIRRYIIENPWRHSMKKVA
jgi:putative transposase